MRTELLRGRCLLAALAVCFAGGATAHAHPVSLTAALIDVKQDRVEVKLAIMVEDLVLFHDMEPDADWTYSRRAIDEKAHTHHAFLDRHFHVRDQGGVRLDATFVETDLDDVPEEGVDHGDLMGHWIVYRIVYPLERPEPYLTVFQNFDGDDPRIPSEMDVQIHHHGVKLESAVLTHNTGYTIGLDWDLDLENLDDQAIERAREQMQARRDERGLGITSYSQIYSYLYVTDHEVRHELLIPALTLERWVTMERDDPDRLTVAEQQAAREQIGAFLDSHHRLRIDDQAVTLKLDRVEFFGPDFRDFAQGAPETDVSVYNARVGVVLAHDVDRPPQRVTYRWTAFDERTPRLEPVVFPFDQPRERFEVDPRNDSFTWRGRWTPEPVELASVSDPEPPPTMRLSLVLLLGAGVALMLTVLATGPGRRPMRRRIVWAVLAVLVLGASFIGRDRLEASVPHPLERRPAMDADQARTVFEALHGNIYRAFAHRRERAIYDTLAHSVSGPLREQLYLQVRQSLTAQDQGGAVARVEAVELKEGSHREHTGSSEAYQAFDYEARWSVTGTIEHWGHIHQRRNEYRAVFTVEGLPEGWRITHFEPLDEQRLEMRTRLRD